MRKGDAHKEIAALPIFNVRITYSNPKTNCITGAGRTEKPVGGCWRIINGRTADPLEFPFQVSIQIRK